MKWMDTTTYSRGQTTRVPTAFSAVCGPVRMVVTCGHINYPGQWIGHTLPVFESVPLAATSREDAQAELFVRTRRWLAAALMKFNAAMLEELDERQAEQRLRESGTQCGDTGEPNAV